MSDIVIKVENLSKLYKIGAPQERYKTLRDTITEAFVAPFRRLKNSQSAIPTIIIRPSRGWISLRLQDLWEYRELQENDISSPGSSVL